MVRSALGGGQSRLVRMLLAEAALLSALSAVVGLGVYRVVAGRIGGAVLPGNIRLDSVGLGWNAAPLVALGGAAAFTAFLVGLAPSLRATRLATAGAPFGTGTRATSHRSRLRTGLIGVQVAIAVVLLLGASLFGRGLRTALAIDHGFDPAPLSVVSVNLGLARYDPDRATVFLRDAEDRIATQPGLRSMTWTTTPPLVGERSIETFHVEGQERDPAGQPAGAINVVTPGFWTTYGIEATAGRLLEAADVPGGEPVAVVTDAFVTQYLGDAQPLGTRVSFSGTPRRVVGVVRSMTYGDLSDAPDPMVYLPVAQVDGTAALGELFLVVRGAGPAAAAAAATLKEIDPAVPVRDLGPYPPLVAQRLLAQRLAFGLLLAFGVLALVVAAIGIFSVMAHLVAARTREFGVRSALGATRGSLVGLVMGEQLLPVGAGLAVGTAAGIALGRLTASLLYGVAPADPAALAVALGVLVTAAAAAALFPAWRGSRLDPVTALRED
jgi:predicted permease